jgi:hypothetical protein
MQDWESRGLAHNMQQDGIVFRIKMRGKARLVVCTSDQLAGLKADAQWLLDPTMGSDARLKAACRRFMKNVEEVAS